MLPTRRLHFEQPGVGGRKKKVPQVVGTARASSLEATLSQVLPMVRIQ